MNWEKIGVVIGKTLGILAVLFILGIVVFTAITGKVGIAVALVLLFAWRTWAQVRAIREYLVLQSLLNNQPLDAKVHIDAKELERVINMINYKNARLGGPN